MDPEFGVGIGSERTGGGTRRPRPSLAVRLLELLGLAVVTYGLGDLHFGLAALGGAMIISSYALFRRKHGPSPPPGPNSGLDGMDSDGGGD